MTALDHSSDTHASTYAELLFAEEMSVPQAIVAAPPLPFAGAGMADEHGSVAQTVLSKEASTSRSRAWVSRSAASGSGSQRTSSISSWAENEPLSGRIAQ